MRRLSQLTFVYWKAADAKQRLQWAYIKCSSNCGAWQGSNLRTRSATWPRQVNYWTTDNNIKQLPKLRHRVSIQPTIRLSCVYGSPNCAVPPSSWVIMDGLAFRATAVYWTHISHIGVPATLLYSAQSKVKVMTKNLTSFMVLHLFFTKLHQLLIWLAD